MPRQLPPVRGAGAQRPRCAIRDLVRHALHHRPDRIVVGEVRGAEVADVLQAFNTDHDASLATVHVNNAEAALSRLATYATQASNALRWSRASGKPSRSPDSFASRRNWPAVHRVRQLMDQATGEPTRRRSAPRSPMRSGFPTGC